MRRSAVIGAGMTGLVVALRLAERGQAVTVFERDAVVGGLVASFTPVDGGDRLERFYHHLFATDRRLRAIIAEVGLGESLYWSTPITACLCGDTVARLDSPSSLLRFAPLAFGDRLRLGFALALLKAKPQPGSYRSVRAARWLRRMAGKTAYECVFGPLFRGKFGSFAEEVSLAWFWARIHDRTARLGYIRGGFAALYEALASRVRDRGGEIRLGDAARKVEKVGEGLRVTAESGFSAVFDEVIATMPVRALARLAPELPQSFIERYQEAPGLWARCVILALDRPLSGAYWINVCDRGAPFSVIVEHTNLRDAAAYGGRHIVYLGQYAERLGAVDPDETLRLCVPLLQRINPQFHCDWILQSWEFRAPDAQPLVGTDYARAITPFRTPVDGLYVANLFQVYPHDRGQNYAAVLGEAVAATID